MNKNRGQALVEFIIIVPILLLILLGIVDFGNIIYRKLTLESTLDTVVDLYESNKQTELEKFVTESDVTYKQEVDEEFIHIILTKDVNIMTPGLNTILNNPYEIKVERIVYHE